MTTIYDHAHCVSCGVDMVGLWNTCYKCHVHAVDDASRQVASRWPVAVAAFVVLVALACVYGMELNRRDNVAQIVALQRLAKDATETVYRMENRIMRARMSPEEKQLWRQGVDEIEKRGEAVKIKGRPIMAKGKK